MRRALIDTNIYVAFKRGESAVVEAFRHLDFIGMNLIVLGELLAGFKSGKKEKANRHELEEFLDQPRVHYIANDLATAEFYAQIFNALRTKGTPIPTNDIWIAASAMQNGLSMFSLDKHFFRVDGLLIQEAGTD